MTNTPTDQNLPLGTVRQLRLVVEVEDFEAAVQFYRDTLGLPEQPAFQGPDEGARVAILHAGHATLELATPAQRRMIDRAEVDGETEHRMKVALQVDDVESVTGDLVAAGAALVAAPRNTPWRSRNARLDGPGGLAITLFQELESLAQRSRRTGFGLATGRRRVTRAR